MDSTLIFNALAAINVAAFALFLYDKFLAKMHWRRVPEATLLLLCAVGGAAGGFAAMQLVRHKTRKPKFRYGVPALLLLQAGLALFLWVRFGAPVV